MGQPQFRTESAVEFFKEMVEGALAHQRIQVSDLTAYYLVNLLAGFIRNDHDPLATSEPLAIRLAEALQHGGVRQREALRRVGDCSLFVSGFFADSLSRKLVDVDYYVALGGYAYGSLRDDEALPEVFGELAERFIDCVDVLAEVSERSALNSNGDLLRMYEKWLRTGSRRGGALLVERGLVPNAAAKTRFLQ